MLRRSCLRLCIAASLVSLASCVEFPDDNELEVASQEVAIPPKGTATTLDFGSWNLEWFGDPSNGPTNDTLQRQNATDVIAGTDFDIWGFAEIVSSAQWNTMEAALPGYTGFVANEASVIDGPAFYSDFSNTEQKVAILYKSAIATALDARIILTANDTDFAGRPPMQVKLRVTLNGTTEDIVVIVMHPKCCSDTTSWQRRVNASNALKAYLDTNFPTTKVWVIGDFNDDVDTSITSGHASPYANFVNDPARYSIPTKALSDAGIATTTGFPDAIDHHLNTNEARAMLIDGSVEAYRVDQFIASYSTTTSDHFPVLSRYSWAAGTGASVTVTSPNGGETFAPSTTQAITWTSSGVADVKLEYSLDNGATFTVITASTPATPGTFSWTVPAANTNLARVRVSDVASAASDTSDGTFTIAASGGTAQVIINEILANEPGSATAGEAVELVNIGTAPATIDGWTVSDSSSVRHTFPAGTTLQPGKAIAVFGGASGIPPGLTNAVAASTGGLSLNNGGDTVSLRDGAGAVKDSFTYGSSLSSTDGVSMNRNPDASTGPFVLHTSISSLPRSPGTRATGSAF